MPKIAAHNILSCSFPKAFPPQNSGLLDKKTSAHKENPENNCFSYSKHYFESLPKDIPKRSPDLFNIFLT